MVYSSCSNLHPTYCCSRQQWVQILSLMVSPHDSTSAKGMLYIILIYPPEDLADVTLYRQFSAEFLHSWVSRHLPDGPRPPIVRPVNYIRIISVTTIILGLITLLSVASPFILPVIQNRNVWAAISIVAILLFTSGHMFNHIRKVPYVAGDGKGGINYFAGGFTNQFGLESQIVAAICKFHGGILLRPNAMFKVYVLLTSTIRWDPLFCDGMSGFEGASYSRSTYTAGFCAHLGCDYAWNV